MKYLLDTDICIYIINRKPPSVIKAIRKRELDEIVISSITQAELEYGVVRSGMPDRNRVALLQFLFPFQLLDFDQLAAVQYGLIRASLVSTGKPIGPMDMLIAAQAGSRDLILVTNNEKEFRRVEGMKVENWVTR
jgi:tRNA(fMet)-specific endonuclease VapC